jgi:hypothetical protein
MDLTGKLFAWGLALFSVAGFGFLVWMIVCTESSEAKHREFLKANGCQLFFSRPTGRDLGNVKIHHYEYVYVYECADGTRTELH